MLTQKCQKLWIQHKLAHRRETQPWPQGGSNLKDRCKQLDALNKSYYDTYRTLPSRALSLTTSVPISADVGGVTFPDCLTNTQRISLPSSCSLTVSKPTVNSLVSKSFPGASLRGETGHHSTEHLYLKVKAHTCRSDATQRGSDCFCCYHLKHYLKHDQSSSAAPFS